MRKKIAVAYWGLGEIPGKLVAEKLYGPALRIRAERSSLSILLRK